MTPTIDEILDALPEASDRLMAARCKLITLDTWYGTMAALFQWQESSMIPTMGVRMMSGGRVECLYNPLFIAALAPDNSEESIDRLRALLIHEVEHVVRMHCIRGLSYNHMLFNFACDMIINGPKDHPAIKNLPRVPLIAKDNDTGEYYIEQDEHGNDIWSDGVYFPNNQKAPNINITAEKLYQWLREQSDKCQNCGQPLSGQQDGQQGQGHTGQNHGQGQNQGQGQGDGQDDGEEEEEGQSGGGGGCCPSCGEEIPQGHGLSGFPGIDGVLLDDHAIWKSSTADADEARQTVRGLIEQSNQCGNAPGHLKEAIEELQQPKVNWKYELKHNIGREVGGKRITMARRNRRHNRFGVPGRSSRASVPLTILVDVSGSISSKVLRQFFGEIESISHSFKITMVQFDHEIQYITTYHRGDWRKIGAMGRGGTSFENAFKGVEEKRLVGHINLVLTDGYAPFPPERPYPVLWCCTTDVKIPWGRIIRIDVKE